MRRSEVRETIFRLLFARLFTSAPEMGEQVTLYLDSLRDGREDAAYPVPPSDEDEQLIRGKIDAVMEKIPEIDEELNKTSRGWKTSRMNKVDLSILRLAVYEIRFDDDIPVGVAINEAVEIAKRYGGDDSASFINGILGQIAKNAGAGHDAAGEPTAEESPAAEAQADAEEKKQTGERA